MQVLINTIGIVIIDVGAVLFTYLYEEHYCIAVILIMLCNIVGGLLYRYDEVEDEIVDIRKHRKIKGLRTRKSQ